MIVHGDDFLAGGPEEEIQQFKEEMSNKYEAKHQTMGPCKHHLKRMKVLNREIEWHENKITMEPDRKHVKAILEELKLENANTVSTPGVKDRFEKVQQEKEKQAQENCKHERDNDESQVSQERRRLRKEINNANVEDIDKETQPRFEVDIDGRPKEGGI